MPDYHTTIKLMNTEFPVTVTWDVCGIEDGAPNYELEAVVSDLLGDVTHLVLGSLQGYTFTKLVSDTGWQDPVRTALFGRDQLYHAGDSRVGPHAQPYEGYQPNQGLGRPAALVVQREPVRCEIHTFSALQQKIFDEIDDLPEQPDRVQAHLDWMSEIEY